MRYSNPWYPPRSSDSNVWTNFSRSLGHHRFEPVARNARDRLGAPPGDFFVGGTHVQQPPPGVRIHDPEHVARVLGELAKHLLARPQFRLGPLVGDERAVQGLAHVGRVGRHRVDLRLQLLQRLSQRLLGPFARGDVAHRHDRPSQYAAGVVHGGGREHRREHAAVAHADARLVLSDRRGRNGRGQDGVERPAEKRQLHPLDRSTHDRIPSLTRLFPCRSPSDAARLEQRESSGHEVYASGMTGAPARTPPPGCGRGAHSRAFVPPAPVGNRGRFKDSTDFLRESLIPVIFLTAFSASRMLRSVRFPDGVWRPATSGDERTERGRTRT